jgi:ethanolamine ammonia-lyase large subunit
MIATQVVNGHSYQFNSLVELLGKASPKRSGDELAGCAASCETERAAAQAALAEVDLTTFLNEAIVPYESDEVTRLILDSHSADAFEPISHLSVGGFRDWLLEIAARPDASTTLAAVAPGITPEMAAAVSKIMRNSDLIAVGKACRVVTAFRTTLGLSGRLATRLQPNHPTDDLRGVAASLLDGLLLGQGDAVVGINPAGDSPQASADLLGLLDEVRQAYDIPMQSCVLSHLSTTIGLIEAGAPVDLVFQSIGGTQGTNTSFGVDLAMLREGLAAGQSLGRGTVGNNVMYFETGQGSSLSAGANLGAGGRPVDQQTLEARAYGLAREFSPLLVNTVVGFIGPEYLYDGKQIIRAGLEDHFCGKLLGLPMGVDVCYTNHAEADFDDLDTLLTVLAAAGVNFVITVPGADDVMLGYQSLSYHDALVIRHAMGLKPAPEFEAWLKRQGIADAYGTVRGLELGASRLRALAGAAS